MSAPRRPRNTEFSEPAIRRTAAQGALDEGWSDLLDGLAGSVARAGCQAVHGPCQILTAPEHRDGESRPS